MPDTTGFGTTVFGHVRVDVHDDGVGVVTLDRPAKLNAVTGPFFADLDRAMRFLGGVASCRAVVLCGAGRAFCAGMDLDEGLVGEPRDDPMRSSFAIMRQAVSAVTAIRDIPQPVIAAVHGHAVGAGFALAAVADIRLCSPDARFHAVFADLGMSAGDLGLSWLLPRLIGQGHAAELFYTGDVLTAGRAAELGFVQRIVENPLRSARELATRIASKPPLGVQMSKELLDASIGASGFREHLELELRSQVIGLHSRDHIAAADAFTARRHPTPVS